MCSSTPRPERRINSTSSIICTSGYSDRPVCRGCPSGTCSASAWRWGYDAERLCSPLVGVYDKNQSRPTTCAANNYIFKNHILHGLGDIPLSELTVEQVRDFLEERKRFGGHRLESPEYPGLDEHTMRHIHRLLQQCLDQAIRDGLIAKILPVRFTTQSPRRSAPMC